MRVPGDLFSDRDAMSHAPIQIIAASVRQHFANSDRDVTPDAVVEVLHEEAGAKLLGDRTLRLVAEDLVAEFGGAGPLAHLIKEPGVTDVLVNGHDVWVDRGLGLCREKIDLGGVDEVRRLAQRLASVGGRRLDDASPCVDAQLPDGTRLHAVLPPVARGGPYLSLRTFHHHGITVRELIECGTLTTDSASLLAGVISARLPFLITGGAGCGKSTLLTALLALVPPCERIVLVEDSAELQPRHPHVVALQARTANVEGAGIITLRDLVRQALRMRPDRLVIGECRGAEVVDLLGALNTGQEGGAATLHANAPRDVPARLESLGLLGGVPRAAIHAQIGAALPVIVHLRRQGGARVVDEICLLSVGAGHLVTTSPAWTRDSGPGPAAGELAGLFACPREPVREASA